MLREGGMSLALACESVAVCDTMHFADSATLPPSSHIAVQWLGTVSLEFRPNAATVERKQTAYIFYEFL